jgi:hypothetical protein
MRWTRRRKSSSLGMCRCIPRTYSRRYNHLSLGMPESSPYSSTNMRLSRSYSILPVHMICIVLTCIIIVFICLGFTFFSFIRLFSWFLLLLLLSLINSKQQKYFLLFCFLFGSLFWSYLVFTFDFYFRVFLAVASMFRSCLASGLLVYKSKVPSFIHLA